MTTREQRLRDDEGFPAFPVDPKAHECSDAEYMALRGMSLRDYFAAHAPDPQAWFSPDMPPKPTSDWVSDDGLTHYFTWQDAQRECGDCYYDANRDAIAQWEAEYSKQWCVQWPYAWADAMLKARKEPGQ
ncbi:hypothetical protein SAMN04487785_11436 [Dyella jiangningensis]|uniref:hypothetical protein n=1 Tax=Dyella sp. AtDHG13 TaxID=1938897 RepID=UPI0008878A38|nr:hypothetical protein [Dyella sp. AtDHG13]PXV54185.1 hypothetical protein BDW41_113138 [Dyella sp. AtDHG13]SDL04938.1 hypothetical protein SAMN04487785_11436 [Dyella jiangningensis]